MQSRVSLDDEALQSTTRMAEAADGLDTTAGMEASHRSAAAARAGNSVSIEANLTTPEADAASRSCRPSWKLYVAAGVVALSL